MQTKNIPQKDIRILGVFQNPQCIWDFAEQQYKIPIKSQIYSEFNSKPEQQLRGWSRFLTPPCCFKVFSCGPFKQEAL